MAKPKRPFQSCPMKIEVKRKTLKERMLDTLATTTKQLLWFFAINGVLWIWCSYILAFLGRDQIAEALSSNVCTIVIGQMAMYIISKTFENIFKYNTFGGHKQVAPEQEEIDYDERPTVPAVPFQPEPRDDDESDSDSSDDGSNVVDPTQVAE